MLVRRELSADAGAVARVHDGAFEAPPGADHPVEVDLVERLRRSRAWLPHLSLVALAADEVVGHVVCTRAVVEPGGHAVLGLGPLAVLPGRQGQGAGSALMHAVLGAADGCGEPLVGLLGEPTYYGRFGFVPAAELGIEAPDPGWGAYFQVRTLWAYTPGLVGRFRYAAPFEDL